MKQTMTKNLMLYLKHKWFEQIAVGTKLAEYRLATNFWRKRLSGLEIGKSRIMLYDGWPDKHKIGTDKYLEFPFTGFLEETITHPEFGQEPVRVFAIYLIPDGD